MYKSNILSFLITLTFVFIISFVLKSVLQISLTTALYSSMLCVCIILLALIFDNL